MSKVSRTDWEDSLYELAVKASKKWLDEMGSVPGAVVDEKGAAGVRDAVFDLLMDKYKFESFDSSALDEVRKLDPSKTWKWAINDWPDPSIAAKAAEAKDYLPIVTQYAEPDSSWLDRSAANLKLLATQQPYNFPYTKEGLADFLKEIAKHQQEADKADIAAEMREQKLGIPYTDIEFGPRGSAYWLGAVAAPSATEAIDNAVANGTDLTPEQARYLAGLDVLSNTAMWELPGLNLFPSNALINGTTDAILQGVVEGARQLGKTKIDSSTVADPNMALIASAAGMTKPLTVRGAQSIVSQFPGAGPAQFSRGIMRSMKAGDPMEIERNKLASDVKKFNSIITARRKKNIVEEEIRKIAEEFGGKVGPEINYANIADANRATKILPDVRLKAKLLGVAPYEDGTYDVREILHAYDKEPRVRVMWGNDNYYKMKSDLPDSWLDQAARQKGEKVPKAGFRWLDPEDEDLYSKLFGARYSYLDNESMARTAGNRVGDLLGLVGTRLEPTAKFTSVFPPKSGSYKNYKDTDWYQAMDEDKQKLFDKAFKDAQKRDYDTQKMLLLVTNPTSAQVK